MSTLAKCRICMRDYAGISMIPIFSQNELSGKSFSAAELIEVCSSVHVTSFDNLPQQLCYECLNNLINCYNFVELCKRSDRLQRNSIHQDKTETSIANKVSLECKFITPENQPIPHLPLHTFLSLACAECLVKLDTLHLTSQHEVQRSHVTDSLRTLRNVKPRKARNRIGKKRNASESEEAKNISTHIELEPRTHLSNRSPDKKLRQPSETVENNGDNNDDFTKLNGQALAYLCRHCNSEFTTKANRKRHIKSVHDEERPFNCKQCGKHFSLLSVLRDHQVVHTRERNHVCAVCGNAYLHSSALSRHMYVHNGGFKHICQICKKTFPSPAKLREHAVVHTGVRNFVCDFCGKSFGHKNTLMIHRRIHTGEKTQTCTECGKSFIQLSSLRFHMRKHK